MAFYLDFNIRKAILLKGECRNLILKKHPDRLKESEGVYEKYYDSITDPFENVYNKETYSFLKTLEPQPLALHCLQKNQ